MSKSVLRRSAAFVAIKCALLSTTANAVDIAGPVVVGEGEQYRLQNSSIDQNRNRWTLRVKDGGLAELTNVRVTAGSVASQAVLAEGAGTTVVTRGGLLEAETGSGIAATSNAFVSMTNTSVSGSRQGVEATGGGRLQMIGGRIDMQSSDFRGEGALSAGAGSNLLLRGVSINTVVDRDEKKGTTGDGVLAFNDGQISVTNTSITTNGNGANGVQAGWREDRLDGGVIMIDGSRITTLGDGSSGVLSQREGSMVRLDQANIVDTHGVGAHGLHARSGGTVMSYMSSITTREDEAFGVLAERGGKVSMGGDSVVTHGAGAHGVVAKEGASVGLNLMGDGLVNSVTTNGVGSHGAWSEGASSMVSLMNVAIATAADGAMGVRASNGGFIGVSSNTIATAGDGANGVQVDSDGKVDFQHGSIATAGRDAHAVSVQNGGAVNIVQSQLKSNGHTLGVAGAKLANVKFQDVDATVNDGVLANVGTGASFVFDAASSTMSGDLLGAQGAAASATLNDGSSWSGATRGFELIELADSSWRMTADSQVASFVGRNGAIAFDHSDGKFKTLMVDGDYVGDVRLDMNVRLGDDNSEADRLHVKGNTTGTTLVQVNNAGGAGAQTDRGILLVQVDGLSGGQFLQSGRAVAGLHEYYLHKGISSDLNDGNWYLRSELPTETVIPVDPIDPVDQIDPEDQVHPIDPVDPIIPIIRPEVGAYAGNRSAALAMFQTSLHERSGDRALDPAEANVSWARVTHDQNDSIAANQLMSGTDISALQVGTDLFRSKDDRFNTGVMLAVGTAKTEVSSLISPHSAVGKVRGSALGAYGTWYQNPKEAGGLYADAWAQIGRFQNKVQGDGLAEERYDSSAATGSVEAGYAFQVYASEKSRLYVEPQVQLLASSYKIKSGAHQEANGTVVDTSAAGELSARVGVRVFGHSVVDAHRVQPYLALNWWNQANDSRRLTFDGMAIDNATPENIYEVKTGFEAQLSKRLSTWAELGIQRGENSFRNVNGLLGMKYSW